jgi:hypothetical protein
MPIDIDPSGRHGRFNSVLAKFWHGRYAPNTKKNAAPRNMAFRSCPFLREETPSSTTIPEQERKGLKCPSTSNGAALEFPPVWHVCAQAALRIIVFLYIESVR